MSCVMTRVATPLTDTCCTCGTPEIPRVFAGSMWTTPYGAGSLVGTSFVGKSVIVLENPPTYGDLYPLNASQIGRLFETISPVGSCDGLLSNCDRSAGGIELPW